MTRSLDDEIRKLNPVSDQERVPLHLRASVVARATESRTETHVRWRPFAAATATAAAATMLAVAVVRPSVEQPAATGVQHVFTPAAPAGAQQPSQRERLAAGLLGVDPALATQHYIETAMNVCADPGRRSPEAVRREAAARAFRSAGVNERQAVEIALVLDTLGC